MNKTYAAALAGLACFAGAASGQDAAGQGAAALNRPVTDDVIYFLLPDRFDNADPSNDEGGLSGDRLTTGYDPTDKGFYHGGDLAGVERRLDYIRGLGATALWVGPVFVNKPVQGPPGQESAAYHGYWITDFTRVDPHLGTEAEFASLVGAAHERGMKVFLDIVVNHTADVIQYRECVEEAECGYRSLADYPYTTKGRPNGDVINRGFAGDEVRSEDNFAKLTRPDFAFTPYVPNIEAAVKAPDWLNDPIYYHNRGNSRFEGESSLYGDFSGLDDLMTEHPDVVRGMIGIYGDWIERFGLDGFRVDTARHVEPGFWQRFLPAMKARAEAAGRPGFFIFGEVAVRDPAVLAAHTRLDGFEAVLDFALQEATVDVIARGAPTKRLSEVFAADVLYEGGTDATRRLPTFIGNHDDGRFSTFVAQSRPDADDRERFERVRLAYALLLTARGVPVLYAGSEQGFVSDGNDKDAREDMFESRVAVYNDNDLLATDATTASDNFDPDHPLYRFISSMAKIRAAEPALRRGPQIERLAEGDGGLYAFSRIDEENGAEVLMVLNAGDGPRGGQISVDSRSASWTGLQGSCGEAASAPGSYQVSVPARDFLLCRSDW
ncbi:alpha-amylase family glycosyl hydrolase [Parvularcula dongshanensis]|uniref:Glycosidase n=1 Tax=Parvularcula dongshanensis TaxID=1173995 RepID=A0A840I7D8_9PROT|nr:alpha-amylase family glycosyl hydrolase [Parvularcula dongshanensis]MBB4660181.1 glycosidase [Parvularcula dongshanensis]